MPTYGTSVWQGRIRNDPATYNAATYPVGPVVARDIVSNNLDHYCDSFGQVRMNISGASMTPKKTGVVANTWYQITATQPFPILLRASGASYKLRVRLGGLSTAGHAIKFAAVLAPVTDAAAILATNATDSVYVTTTTTSTSATWITGASALTAYTTMMELTGVEAATYTGTTATPVDLSGADSAVLQCLVSLVIYGSTANTGSEPTLVNAYAAEWVG